TERNSTTRRNMEKLDTLEALFLHELKDVYHAEKHLVKAPPKVARKASSSNLRDAIEQHLRQTEGHVERLEEIFEMLDQTRKAIKCQGIEGILDEGERQGKRECCSLPAIQTQPTVGILSSQTQASGIF